MDKETEKNVGICKPTYEEIESKYGRLADRCEFAEKLNKSLERVIVEKDETIETFTREIDDLNKIIREKDMIVKSLTDENCELKKELARAKQEQFDHMLRHRTIEGVINECKIGANIDKMVNDIYAGVKLDEEVKKNEHDNS